ncbi:HNH endonuclease signature motif containing protein [Natronobeatus ordinarius]|uniref:HNH endonuclease signature motif containing protein n=1 Tax=Natronobeatus ordinarius TaxID=2963433 RepID=UPI0020CE9969|nr:HNH endonuclease signature motif containing protein [Natronobeatus ordinarius]
MVISKRTVKKLWWASGNQCAFPNCQRKLIDLELDIVIGEMCHIHARKPGGARYCESMGDNERDSYSNLILMCPTCHRIIDEAPDEFTAELLKQWKREHEQNSSDPPGISPHLLEKLLADIHPTMLVVHVNERDVEILRNVHDWEPDEEYPGEKDRHGSYPIVVTFDNLKKLHDRVALPYRQKRNGRPLYEQNSEWTEDELIQSSAIAAQITKSAIQHYHVESNRRKSRFHDYPCKDFR